ncbi:alpha/beta fold hydrolase [Marinovum sp. 2_MG-2023]|uniref:alpha/beta fold hydrolase n=1 Tax=unclassified Marinovum TaxID=2647166 RepID=UPI0026E443AA|nr:MULTISPECIES: alpha/beta fold hydrolase [unclassified Marinovum]MDO6728580.1 alpha/beta fold hydrolase [Marinovum sp. 2_MG-2023]MDO6778004.1 alpha/beta fold hydrolase [Marinovum sp. 1_MG-2023]
MSDILLIHGSCHGAWAWDTVLPELAALGHDARAIDLPGAGADPTPHSAITLAQYTDAILAALGAHTVVVGHSAAGYPITAAAERAPEKIAKLIYLCAYVPEQGRSMLDLRRDVPSQPAQRPFAKSDDGLSYVALPAAVPLFYSDCPPDLARRAAAQLCPQPIAPQAEVLKLSESSHHLPRHYIRCTKDQTIPPQHQAAMVADWPAQHVHALDTGHSPFISAPRQLADLIDRLCSA